MSDSVWNWSPSDPTAGELSPDEKRRLVRKLAERVGAAVSAKVQEALAAGRPLSEEAEKVASSTEIQNALRTENEARLRAGLSTFSDEAHMGVHDAVMAHVYGLGEVEDTDLLPLRDAPGHVGAEVVGEVVGEGRQLREHVPSAPDGPAPRKPGLPGSGSQPVGQPV